MKTVILAGGKGTRLSEYTKDIPKPMVEIGDQPILYHIMKCYADYGFKDFILALGYKGHLIKEYFVNNLNHSVDISLDLKNNKVTTLTDHPVLDWRVSMIDTGQRTMTGGRLKRLKPYLTERFFLTYGDGLANVDLERLLKFHRSHGRMATVSAVHPVARFGEIEFHTNGQVLNFKEKPQTSSGWINGGFFVLEPSFLDLIEDDDTVLEQHPLEKAAALGELMAFQHDGFWQCMDTIRDRDVLDEFCRAGEPPWQR